MYSIEFFLDEAKLHLLSLCSTEGENNSSVGDLKQTHASIEEQVDLLETRGLWLHGKAKEQTASKVLLLRSHMNQLLVISNKLQGSEDHSFLKREIMDFVNATDKMQMDFHVEAADSSNKESTAATEVEEEVEDIEDDEGISIVSADKCGSMDSDGFIKVLGSEEEKFEEVLPHIDSASSMTTAESLLSSWLASSLLDQQMSAQEKQKFSKPVMSDVDNWLAHKVVTSSAVMKTSSSPSNVKVADWLSTQQKLQDLSVDQTIWLKEANKFTVVGAESFEKEGGDPSPVENRIPPMEETVIKWLPRTTSVSSLSSTVSEDDYSMWLNNEKADREKDVIDSSFDPIIRQYVSVLSKTNQEFLVDLADDTADAPFDDIINRMSSIMEESNDRFLAKPKAPAKKVWKLDDSLCCWLSEEAQTNRCDECPGNCVFDEFNGNKEWRKAACDW